MDANGTRYHLLLGEGDWTGRTQRSDVEWDGNCGVVTLRPVPYQYPASADDRPPSLDDRRGAARDRYGNWYWIDESRTGLVARSSGSSTTAQFWSPSMTSPPARPRPAGAFAPIDQPAPVSTPLLLAGLVVTTNHYLVAGVTAPAAGLLVFDLHAGGPPEVLCWPPDVEFAPFDMAPAEDGGVWILDRDHKRIWRIDAAFRVVLRTTTQASAPLFTPTDGAMPGRTTAVPRRPLTTADAWDAPGDSISIEVLPGDALVLLDRPPGASSTIHYYAAVDAAPAAFSLNTHGIAGHDLAAIAKSTEAEIADLFVVAEEGNQAYAFTLKPTATGGVDLIRVPANYYPMRLFGGKGLVNAGGTLYYDFNRTWIPLVDQLRPRYVPSGSVTIEVLDGREPDCVWHRILIDGVIPSDAALDVLTRAANSEEELDSVPWQREPRPYLRSGSELPFAPEATGDGAGTWELLLQNARGRFLAITLLLKGSGKSTPRVRALRVYYPRFSYLQYLPAVYREDRESASFLDRFLANVEGTLTSIEDRIAASQALIDMRSAPPDALEWLASWVGLALDPTWDDAKRRMLLRHAPLVFAKRGTVDGLRIALALSLSECANAALFTDTSSPRSPAAEIRIIEQFRTRRVPPVVSGDPTDLTGIRAVAVSSKWTPEAGGDGLKAAWGGEIPLAQPRDRDAAQEWRTKARTILGFVPAIATADVRQWRQFLAARYHGVASFSEVYGKSGLPPVTSFDQVQLPAALPPDGAPLLDWYEFETRTLAISSRAHRFLVLLPVAAGNEADSPEHERALEVARRVTNIEKPAHTVFDVRFYWAMFRVGEVRLGLDTLLARRPKLPTPLVLNRSHLAESYLAPSHPQNAGDRALVLGRGTLEPRPRAGETS